MHKDYLGTILAITDEKGKLVEERHFDAWGNLTHGSMQVLDRGYTSHEHLQEVGLIHMNGRLYDPMLLRFLNADENIQDPTNTQCYNKYGYVMNNTILVLKLPKPKLTTKYTNQKRLYEIITVNWNLIPFEL